MWPSDIYAGDNNISEIQSDFDLNKYAPSHKYDILPKLIPGPNGDVLYHAYLQLSFKNERHKEQVYDLTTSPHDVCMYVTSGYYMFPRHSNTITIPQDQIRAALHYGVPGPGT